MDEEIIRIVGEYGAFNHMGIKEGNTVVEGIKTLGGSLG